MIEVHPHHAAVMLTIVAQKLLFTKDALLFIKPIFWFSEPFCTNALVLDDLLHHLSFVRK